jgi:hypothetical protein
MVGKLQAVEPLDWKVSAAEWLPDIGAVPGETRPDDLHVASGSKEICQDVSAPQGVVGHVPGENHNSGPGSEQAPRRGLRCRKGWRNYHWIVTEPDGQRYEDIAGRSLQNIGAVQGEIAEMEQERLELWWVAGHERLFRPNHGIPHGWLMTGALELAAQLSDYFVTCRELAHGVLEIVRNLFELSIVVCVVPATERWQPADSAAQP